MSIKSKAATPPLTIIDPVQEARAMAFHLGREEAGGQPPRVPVMEAAEDLRTAELEYIMAGVPA